MSVEDLLRPEIRALRSYDAALQETGALRLNANEVPTSLLDIGASIELNRYPQVRPEKLCRLLATLYGATPEQLVVTRGSSEAIDLLIRACCRAGSDRVLSLAPSFAMYEHYARIQACAFDQLELQAAKNFTATSDEILAACAPETRILFLCSPNNPTGNSIPETVIDEVLRARAEQSLVVVDEAYVEFSSRPSVLPLLEKYNNLVVLRTLSKAGGLAGLRCGAALAAPSIVAALRCIQAPYAFATPVLDATEAALASDLRDMRTAQIDETRHERQRLANGLSNSVLIDKIWPSDANFLLAKTGAMDELQRICAEHDISLRFFGKTIPGCVRITVGSKPENDRLLAVLNATSRSAT
jgi:histidinol-phosphate aminotransferase